MARRKKDEVEIIEETKVTEEIETPAEQPEVVAEVKEVKKSVKKKASSVKITAPRVNIRKSPSLAGDIQKIAVAGEKFDLVNDSDDGFYEIKCDNSNAFVMKEFATLA